MKNLEDATYREADGRTKVGCVMGERSDDRKQRRLTHINPGALGSSVYLRLGRRARTSRSLGHLQDTNMWKLRPKLQCCPSIKQ